MFGKQITRAVIVIAMMTMGVGAGVTPAAAEGPNAIRTDPAFTANVLARNDDGSTPNVPIGFPINFFGANYSSLYVNNNGNVTFDGPEWTYTPFDINSAGVKMIAPFFGDVDTRHPSSGVTVYGYGTGIVDGHAAFGVNWVNVGYYNARVDKLNSFQLVMIRRDDIAAGDFDIEFNYDKIQWETGEASYGVNGLGGYSARAGYANGLGSTYELPGSAVNGAFLDGNLTSGLIHSSLNSTQLGRYTFRVRSGLVQPVEPDVTVDAGPDAAGGEGSPITLTGSATGTSHSWSYTAGAGVDAGATCTFVDASAAATSATCTDDGTYTMTLTSTQGSATASDNAIVTVGNVAPNVTGLTLSGNGAVACTGGNAVSANFGATDAGTNDVVSGLFDWGHAGATSPGFTGSHLYPAGSYTVTGTASDDDAGSSSTSASFSLLYNTGGIQQPINKDGSSNFKLGRVIPVKIGATDCNGLFVTSIQPLISLVRLGSGDGTVNEVVSSSSADTGNTMRWADDHYHFNLSTKLSQFNSGQDLTPGRYRLTISAPEIAPVIVEFDIRS